MSEQLYLLSLGLILGTVLVVFVMKYFTASQQARARMADEGAYRKLAADAVTAQSGNAATLSAIQSELAEIKMRMTSIEKILKEVE